MRCYHICNFYLAGIHAGIQSAHTQHELAVKYLAATPFRDCVAEETLDEFGARLDRHSDAKQQYLYWANDHKTVILLNGGMAKQLLELEAFLKDNKHSYAWASFREEEDALNNAITNVGIVLPEHMYSYSSTVLSFADQAWPGLTLMKINGEDVSLSRDHNQTIAIRTVSDNLPVALYTPFDIELMKRLSTLKLM